jgi:solute carrier family 34 (sodium-dependent phosphate cotransporter)
MSEIDQKNKSSRGKSLFKQITLILIVVIIFLFGIDLMALAFRSLGRDVAESILLATSNPFISLFIGLLITALIQSSSTSTSMIVAAVASGSIAIDNAVPMIMGANIGTTITSTIVSLGYIQKPKEFRKAISAGTIHDFFNIVLTTILFPLEYYYQFLSDLSIHITAWLPNLARENSLPFIKGSGSFIFGQTIYQIAEWIPYPIVLILISFGILFLSIRFLSKLIYHNFIGDSQSQLRKFLFKSPAKSFLWGTGITAAVQSSSVTTTLIVPFVATGKITLKKAFPFIIGANLGTTITALLAALFKSDAAISIALVHLLFNLFGVLLFLPFSAIRAIPVYIARNFGLMTMNYRITGFVYIILTFFLIPFALIYFNKGEKEIKELIYTEWSVENESREKWVIAKTTEDDREDRWSVFHAPDFRRPLKTQIPDEIYSVSIKNNVFLINQEHFLIDKKGYCWDGEDSQGTFTTCIEEDDEAYTLDNGEILQNVYLFQRTYFQSDTITLIKRFYLHPQRKLLLRLEVIDNMGKKIRTEALRIESN